ncbi:hypothetical protein [Pedobacter borealis]|nr:hypothetical protein [Pedobacter borealis]
MSVIRLPWPSKPDGTDADRAHFFNQQLSAVGTNEELLELFSKKMH